MHRTASDYFVEKQPHENASFRKGYHFVSSQNSNLYQTSESTQCLNATWWFLFSFINNLLQFRWSIGPRTSQVCIFYAFKCWYRPTPSKYKSLWHLPKCHINYQIWIQNRPRMFFALWTQLALRVINIHHACILLCYHWLLNDLETLLFFNWPLSNKGVLIEPIVH